MFAGALFGVGDEFRILDPVGADCGDQNPPAKKLTAKTAAVAVQECLGGGIEIQIRKGLKGRGGTDFQDPATPVHEREAQQGHCHGCFAVQVDHIQAVVYGKILVIPDLSVAGGIDQDRDVRLVGI